MKNIFPHFNFQLSFSPRESPAPVPVCRHSAAFLGTQSLHQTSRKVLLGQSLRPRPPVPPGFGGAVGTQMSIQRHRSCSPGYFGRERSPVKAYPRGICQQRAMPGWVSLPAPLRMLNQCRRGRRKATDADIAAPSKCLSPGRRGPAQHVPVPAGRAGGDTGSCLPPSGGGVSQTRVGQILEDAVLGQLTRIKA